MLTMKFPKRDSEALHIVGMLKYLRAISIENIRAIEMLADAISNTWEINNKNYNQPQKSVELRRLDDKNAVLDRPIPIKFLAKQLLNLDQLDYRTPYIESVLHKQSFACLITEKEKQYLNKLGLEHDMPSDWNGIDRYARYEKAGISMGELQPYKNEDFERLLTSPQSSYYVYKLLTPNLKTFYIGKGDKKRALQHEKELLSRSFKTHTNWKKLNKIASILNSGKRVLYEIESWHGSEQAAYLRESELILLAERDNPSILCNSNGSRWKGKPSLQLIKYRNENGLDTTVI